jgi:hypothetical protein
MPYKSMPCYFTATTRSCAAGRDGRRHRLGGKRRLLRDLVASSLVNCPTDGPVWVPARRWRDGSCTHHGLGHRRWASPWRGHRLRLLTSTVRRQRTPRPRGRCPYPAEHTTARRTPASVCAPTQMNVNGWSSVRFGSPSWRWP